MGSVNANLDNCYLYHIGKLQTVEARWKNFGSEVIICGGTHFKQVESIPMSWKWRLKYILLWRIQWGLRLSVYMESCTYRGKIITRHTYDERERKFTETPRGVQCEQLKTAQTVQTTTHITNVIHAVRANQSQKGECERICYALTNL